MAEIRILDSGIVYRGPRPDTPMSNAYWPTVVELGSGELVVAMNIATAMSTPDTRAYCCRSSDGGKTWTAPEKIFEPDESEHPVQVTVRINRTPDEQLVGFTTLLDRSRIGSPRTNPETGGTVEMAHAIVRSDDGGLSWSGPQTFRSPLDWECYGEPSPILPLSANRWLLPSLTRLNWEGECPLDLKAFAMISEDQGLTWPRAVDVFNHWAERIICWEQKQTRLTDGRLLAVTWAFDTVAKQNLRNRYTFTSDEGDSYGASLESPLDGQTCTPLGLDGNHVLFAYRRSDKPGLWAHLAHINDTDWRPVAETLLWGGEVKGLADSSIQHMTGLKFGFPQLIRAADGAVFLVFWGVEDGLSVIRWFRLAVEL